MVGLLVGSFFFGVLGDAIGRRRALLCAVSLCCLSGLAGSYAPGYGWYCASRFLAGSGAYGCCYVAIVQAIELAGDGTRTFVGMNIEVAFGAGSAAVSLVGIRVKEWRQFQVWMVGVLEFSVY